MDETTITGILPNMTVEISHRADPEGGAELMTINLRATPDFQAALPLIGGLGQMAPLLAPMQMWSQAMEAWMAPWRDMTRQLAQANPLLHLVGEFPPRK